MSAKKLSTQNRYLKANTAHKMRVRSLASSTAIETRESVASIEEKLTHEKPPARHRLTLA
jgi:hypothetical protein